MLSNARETRRPGTEAAHAQLGRDVDALRETKVARPLADAKTFERCDPPWSQPATSSGKASLDQPCPTEPNGTDRPRSAAATSRPSTAQGFRVE